jgi:hypothetical protein
MKTFTISIPTKKEEIKNCLMQLFVWITHPGRMKRNKSLFNELYREICDELNSNYWSNDISKEMRDRLTSPYGKIAEMIFEKKNRLL